MKSSNVIPRPASIIKEWRAGICHQMAGPSHRRLVLNIGVPRCADIRNCDPTIRHSSGVRAELGALVEFKILPGNRAGFTTDGGVYVTEERLLVISNQPT